MFFKRRTIDALSVFFAFLAIACVGARAVPAQEPSSYFPGASLLPESVLSQCVDLPDASDSLDAQSIVRAANLSALPVAPYRGRVFSYGIASWGSQEAQNRTIDRGGFDVGSFGGALGQDWTLTDYFIWGYGVQGTQTNVDAKNSGSYDSRIDSVAGFLRMSVFDALWRVELLYGGARNTTKQTKIGSGAANKFDATEWFFESEFGARFDRGYTRIEPRANFRILSLVEPQKAERFVVSNERPEEFSEASYRMKIGSRFSWEYATAFGVVTPYISADWSHEFGSRYIYTIGDQAPIPVAYRQGAHKMARDKLDLCAGLDYALRDTFDVYIRYDVEIAKEYADYLFFAGFNKKF